MIYLPSKKLQVGSTLRVEYHNHDPLTSGVASPQAKTTCSWYDLLSPSPRLRVVTRPGRGRARPRPSGRGITRLAELHTRVATQRLRESKSEQVRAE